MSLSHSKPGSGGWKTNSQVKSSHLLQNGGRDMADQQIEVPRSPCALPSRLRAESACREWVYFWAVHCRASVVFFFLAHPQISEMLVWKIPAWLSHTERREEWSPTRRHLVFRAPGVRERQPRQRRLLGKRSEVLGWCGA